MFVWNPIVTNHLSTNVQILFKICKHEPLGKRTFDCMRLYKKEMNALHVQYNGIVADIKTQLKQTEQDASSSEASRLVLEEEYVRLKNLITPQTETMEDLADELRRALERERNVQKELNVYKHQAMGVDVRLHDLEYSSLSRRSHGSHGSHGSGRSFKEERERERERERILKTDHQHHHPKVHVSRRGSITVSE